MSAEHPAAQGRIDWMRAWEEETERLTAAVTSVYTTEDEDA